MSDPKEQKKEIKLPENIPVDYTFEKILKVFLKKSQDIIKEVKEKRYYQKPSAIRHKLEGSLARKRKLARRRKK
jgi:ribosomal protein S21